MSKAIVAGAGIVLMSLLLSACTVIGKNSDARWGSRQIYGRYMPDGMRLSVRCRQTGFFGAFIGDIDHCAPMLTPVWWVNPDDLFKNRG
ncbi:hypothetical protein [Candidatus Sororendozoicomonas aggregata]|uniref:hypothetical protein n=1 Tax=Candidatus Sororendozoicomonas aggregata TaxID=3073239 RepID=UPI002ED3C8E6